MVLLIRRILFGLMLCAASTASWAATEPNSAVTWDVKALMRDLAQVKSAKATFVEQKYLSILTKPLESSGTLIYTAPDRLEKHTLLPKPESMILERDSITLENKTKNQRRTVMLQDYPVIWTFVESIRSTLAGDLETLNRFYKVKLEGNSNEWHLSMAPSQRAMQDVVSEIRIDGNKNRIKTITINEASGDRSVMKINEDSQ
ncbi:MAG: outer membrane lipoprotein carrier protein LolA [Pseudomonadota bacterium]